MPTKPEKFNTARQLTLALRENLRLKSLAGAAISETQLVRKNLEDQRDAISVLCEILAFIRLGVRNLNTEGAGIATASMVSGHDRLWRRLPAEVVARIEACERAIEEAFLRRVVVPAWREGQSPALRVLAAQLLGEAGIEAAE
jgi:hypothetical protein